MKKKDLKGKIFTCKRVISGPVIEDIPTMRKHLQDQIKNIPEAKMTETKTAFELNNGQFFLKPKCQRETTGKLTCKSTYATFNECRIEYKNMIIENDVIITDFAKYTIIKEEEN